MNAELKKIEDWLRSQGAEPESYCDLSKDANGSSLVTDTTADAYDYDSVIKSFYAPGTTHTCSSFDALLLRENLYLIEFKSLGNGVNIFGFDLDKLSQTQLKKVINVLYKVESKLSESLYMLRSWILPVIPTAVDEFRFEKHAIIVFDANQNAASANAASRASASGQVSGSVSVPQRFQERTVDGKPVFYHGVSVWPSNLFSANIKRVS